MNVDPFGLDCKRIAPGPLGETRFVGNCSNVEDLPITQGDRPQVTTVNSSTKPTPSNQSHDYELPFEGYGKALRLVGQNVDAQQAFLAKFAVGSVFGGAVAGGLAIGGSSAAITTLGLRGAVLLPIAPSAVGKLQKIGFSIQQATDLIKSPTAQKLIDNLNGGNINVLQNVGDKIVRVTLDPSGRRIISAGYVQSRNVANGIASGRFTAMK